jgi:hypothetical protein
LNKQELDVDLNDIKSGLTTMEGNVNFLIDTVGQVRQDIIGINLQLQQREDAINQLNNS